MSVSQDGAVGFEALDPELAGEPEDEFEDELFGEPSTESPLGEYEDEFEDEGEDFLGGLLKGLGGALGLGEGEFEDEFELEDEFEDEVLGATPAGQGEYEDEQFLPLLAAAAPLAAKALPLAAKFLPGAMSAISGLFGRRRRRVRRREGEYEGEYEDELEYELEYEDESPAAPITKNEAIAQTMAAAAARTPSTHEAEALIGAATVMMITPREQAVLQRLVPDIVPKLVQVNSILTRMARRRQGTQPIVTILPTAVTRATVRPLVRRARRGQPVTRSTVGRVVQTQTRRALTQPTVAARAAQRNQRAVRRVTQLPRARRGALTG
ncbi:hypothetical protein [Geodermatophilus sp. DSM 45219]|uniref:hypothetical protein n=1 Tax=Geodermatophilus sp. DSM 45219 TaxID=1881103 RepID=UPI00088583EB|nr:hypothetical protein [Geodermatophilus sp. DSM 45219]SDN41427.1 hypothetical protein SAMN05428965_0293 [Geodermatophilus sp. DSM 45219]